MESRYLIDKEELLNFPTEEYSGFCNFVYDLIQKHDFLDREDDAMNLAEDIFDGIMNVIETAEVVEERKYTDCILSESEWDTYFPLYHYTCGECGESIDSLHNDEEYKFCPHCGAEYERIIKCE